MSAPIKTTTYRLSENRGKLPEDNAVQRHKVFRQVIASISGNVRLGIAMFDMPISFPEGRKPTLKSKGQTIGLSAMQSPSMPKCCSHGVMPA